MTTKSGSEFDSHYNGSTGSDGECRSSSDWHKTWETWFWDKGDGNEFISKEDSSNGRSNNHIHYFNNPNEGDKHHKANYEVGERLSSNKSEKSPASNDLFAGIKYFLGFDD